MSVAWGAAMQRAEQNVDERLAALRLALNQARPAEITGELLDIVSGSEAQRAEAGTQAD